MKRTAVLFVAVSICMAFFVQGSRIEAQTDDESVKKAEIAMLRSNVERLVKQVTDMKTELAKLTDENKKLQDLVVELQADKKALQAQVQTNPPIPSQPENAVPRKIQDQPVTKEAASTQMKGFRGIDWGTRIDALKDMEESGGDGILKSYSRKGDKMELGEAKLLKICYEFHKNVFFGVRLYADDDQYLDLRHACVAMYGWGKPGLDYRAFRWQAKDVSIELAQTFLPGAPIGRRAGWQVAIQFEPLAVMYWEEWKAKRDAEKGAAAQKARQDF